AAAEAAGPYLTEALRWLADDETREAGSTGPPIAGAAAPDAGAPDRARVLVVDDNADMREYLARLLAPEYQVAAAVDGVAALAAARRSPPELIVTDVMMPRLDGFGLLAEVRSDPALAGVPVLVLSARAGQEAAVEGLGAGADDYLTKPFAATELLARVRALIRMTRLRRGEASWRAALVASLRDGFFVVDSERRVVEVNDAFADILGYGRDGLPYLPPQPWWPDPATDPEAHALVAEASAAHTSGELEIPCVHRDGHRVWVQAVFSEVTDPQTGRVAQVGTLRDVTAARAAAQRARELADEQLRVADAAVALLAENTDAVVARHDADGRYRYVSPSAFRLTGWRPDQLVGRNPLEYLHPDDRDAAAAAIARLADGPAAEVLMRFRHAEGHHVWVETRARLVTDPDTGDVEIHTVSRDVHARVLAEQQLERFRATAEQTSDVVGMAGADGMTIYLNPAGRALFGLPRDGDVGDLHVTRYITDGVREPLARALAEAAEHGVWAGETEFADRDGEPVPVSQVITAHRDHRGDVAYFSTIARDLRPQRAAEREIHAERERYRTLVAQAPTGIFLADPAGNNVYVNDRLVEIAGRAAAQARGAGWAEHVHPEDRAEVTESWSRAVATGTGWSQEYRAVRPDGRQLWVTATARPLRGPDGAVSGFLGVYTDVTERRDAERAREQAAADRAARAASDTAAARMNALVGGLAAIVWEADAQTWEPTFVSERAVELLGYPTHRWVGDSAFWQSLVHPDDRERVARVCREHTAAGRDYALDYRMVAADGRIVWLRDVVHVVTDPDGT
ncbi:MAG: PAS domain S-box protein, partial [Pseudonocardia sp.]|nr:PAS domain S-box protein [Pseudonocardia sp.]